MRGRGAALMGLTFAGALASWVGSAEEPGGALPVMAPMREERIDARVKEASGLVRGRVHPDVFWAAGDSGTPAALFALDRAGALRRRVDVLGVDNVDWEDLAADDAGHLWIADAGNNANTRRDLRLIRVPEPDPAGAGEVRPDREVRFRYPDQAAFPDPAHLNFDGEALFWSDGRLYLLSKHRSDSETTLYRFPADEGEVVLERVSSFDVGPTAGGDVGKVTSADLSADGARLAVLTYHALFLFERPSHGDDWLSGAVVRVPLWTERTAQCEAVAWDGPGLRVLNEERAWFLLEDASAPPPRFP
jgi:catechol 2,3-dioxygenase-like lactoylglutathione lyase family enzyme